VFQCEVHGVTFYLIISLIYTIGLHLTYFGILNVELMHPTVKTKSIPV